MSNIVSRRDAKAKGLKSYYTGKPCKHGHITERRTHNGECRQCNRNVANRWSTNNPEEKRKRNAKRDHSKYYDPEKSRQYYQNNREHFLLKAWERRNIERGYPLVNKLSISGIIKV